MFLSKTWVILAIAAATLSTAHADQKKKKNPPPPKKKVEFPKPPAIPQYRQDFDIFAVEEKEDLLNNKRYCVRYRLRDTMQGLAWIEVNKVQTSAKCGENTKIPKDRVFVRFQRYVTECHVYKLVFSDGITGERTRADWDDNGVVQKELCRPDRVPVIAAMRPDKFKALTEIRETGWKRDLRRHLRYEPTPEDKDEKVDEEKTDNKEATPDKDDDDDKPRKPRGARGKSEEVD